MLSFEWVATTDIKSYISGMPCNLDPGTFGGTPACHILVEKLNALGDEKLAGSVVRFMAIHIQHCKELEKVNHKTRALMLDLWKAHHWNVNQVLRDKLDASGIEATYIHNIIEGIRRRTLEYGAILDRLRGDDWDDDFKLVHERLLKMDRERKL